MHASASRCLPLKNATFQLFGGDMGYMGYMAVKDELPQVAWSFKG